MNIRRSNNMSLNGVYIMTILRILNAKTNHEYLKCFVFHPDEE